jgi:hypothetical protein
VGERRGFGLALAVVVGRERRGGDWWSTGSRARGGWRVGPCVDHRARAIELFARAVELFARVACRRFAAHVARAASMDEPACHGPSGLIISMGRQQQLSLKPKGSVRTLEWLKKLHNTMQHSRHARIRTPMNTRIKPYPYEHLRRIEHR